MSTQSDVPIAETVRFAWPPEYRIDPTSCRCGGNIAWLQKTEIGTWRMIGCVCHSTPIGVVGVSLIVSVGWNGKPLDTSARTDGEEVE